MDNRELKLAFGVSSPDISKQLQDQGFNFDAGKVVRFDNQRDAIIHLRFGDLLSDTDANKITKKLFNKIKKHIIEQNKTSTDGQRE